jgi:polysaccharide biosynthesis protein PslH
VATTSGSRGLDWVSARAWPAASAAQLLVADEPATFADAVCGLLADPAAAAALGAAGRAYVLRTLDHAALLTRIRERLPDRVR